MRLAPYADPSYEIWGCSPGTYPHASRVDQWFELHFWKPANPCCEINYVKWMSQLGKPVYMVRPVTEVPTSIAYPKEAVLNFVYGTVTDREGNSRPARFNPNDFGSTLSWMLALAIMQKPDEIGLWGVDMAANEEYGPQKDGCLSLLHIAKSIGIKITLPHESDLIRPAPLYGYQEHDPYYIKLSERMTELDHRIGDAMRREQQARDERIFLQGARDDVVYTMKTWIADPQAIGMMYSQPETIEAKPVDVKLEIQFEPLETFDDVKPKANGRFIANASGELEHRAEAHA